MVNYYSQNGEDFLLDEVFKDKKSGFFVEVGCIDGKRFSNTLTFEERGWMGLCIEAHAGYIELLRRNRPNSIICHCAAGEKDEDDAIFYANARGSLSTLDRSKESYFREKYGEYFTGFEEQRVPKRRIDTLFREHGIGEIDILSLDIEGYEVEALKGIDFRYYKPLVLVIESDSSEHEIQIDSMLIPNGYTKSVRIACNIFYFLDPKWEQRIKNKTFHVNLIHTRHPLDNGEDIQTETEIDTRSKNCISRKSVAMLTLRKKMIFVINAVKRMCRRRGQPPPCGNQTRFRFFEIGFHGDQNLLQLVDLMTHNCNYFIETGANVGSTLAYVARTYPHIQCLSCEPDLQAFQHAVKNTISLPNVSIFNETSQEFLKRIAQEHAYLFEGNVLFWLDAHGYGFKWPLKEEIAFITMNFKAAYILIDDFKVPGLQCFGYDEYRGQVCSFDYIRDSFGTDDFDLYYPSYTEHTSEHHPLEGWGLFVINEIFEIPVSLEGKITRWQKSL